MFTKKITGKEMFMKKVLKNKGLTIVKFGTQWNGACQMMAPIYNELALTYKSEAKFYEVFLEEHKELFSDYNINEFPTIIFFMNGEAVEQVKGSAAKKIIKEKIQLLLNQPINQN